MTNDQIKAEARWMLDYIRREWQGCERYSRFARSLPLVLRALIEREDEVTSPTSGAGATASEASGPAAGGTAGSR